MIIPVLTHILAFALGAITIILFQRILRKRGDQKIDCDYVTNDSIYCNDNIESEKNIPQNIIEPLQNVAHERKVSKKELQRLQKKEERARRRKENEERKAALAEQKRKQQFNPRTTKPENITYTNLSVSDGHLMPCSIGQTYYYHSWEYEGRYFFEFYCEPNKIAKAINNRSAIIDPFCQKNSVSVPIDEAKSIDIVEFGEIDSEFNIISKSIITFK